MKIATSLCVIFCLSFLVACERLEIVTNTYQDYQAAIRDGAVKRVRIPTFLPESAAGIVEKHNIDTNEIWLSFSMDKEEMSRLGEFCQTTTIETTLFPEEAGGDSWPHDLINRSKTSSMSDRFNYYQCSDGALLAVQLDERKVFYWKR